jgi:hypothetical protein
MVKKDYYCSITDSPPLSVIQQSGRTKVFLQEQGYYIWLSVVTWYDSSKREKTATKKELKKNNKITMDFIWEGLPNLVREKVGKCSSAK